MIKRTISATVLLFSAATLLAIWPLPNTMALRNVTLLCGGVASAMLLFKELPQLTQRRAWPVYILLGFFIWLALHLFLLAGNLEEQWREFTGEWLRTFLATLMGLALGLLLSQPERLLSRRLQRIQESLLVCGLAGTVFIFCMRYAYEVIRTGQWIHQDFYMTPYLGKTPLVIFGSLFLPVMFIKILSAREGKSPTFWYACAPLGIGATIFSDYFANTKNGIALFFLLFVYFLFKIAGAGKKVRAQRKGFFAMLLACILLTGFVLKNHLESNPAWSNLIADYKISTDIEQHNNWKDRVSPLPLNQYGVPVNGSTYERVSWARAGLDLLKEHPLGYGQIHHSFGALALQKWSDFHKPDGKNRGATHSGWLDFALGFGLPGLFLVWITLGVSYLRARKRSDFWSIYAVWAIPVIAISYLTTEVCIDHFIELLFFMAALFSCLTLQKANQANGAGAD
ncbi:hypothetical protein os4_17760 [Comamonadaceae bacterium OS-4]|nr:hypothetical protein os4_17760 [Comamonadaceae bacterium OS-4]